MIFLPFRRRRLLFWILREYFKKWFKTLIFFFVLGILVTIASLKVLPKFLDQGNTQTIGLTGSYTMDTIPLEIQRKISEGLTQLEEDGEAQPGLASSWEISPDGKTYTIKLKNDASFQDGTKLVASDINYNFKEAKLSFLNEQTIQFTLSEPFSPFLTVISQPILKKGLIGVGEYKVEKIKFNGSFISLLILKNIKQENHEKLIYHFYPTEEALKTAFILGEVNTIKNIYNVSEFQNWKNVEIQKMFGQQELVVIFYNTRDSHLSQKSIRQALTYTLPDIFEEGQAASSPLSFKSFAYQGQPEKFIQDILHAKTLISTPSATLNLLVDPKLENLAKKIAQSWQELGFTTDIKTTRIPPTLGSNFQAYLGIFRIPYDPDQYVLWHSTQQTNITGYGSQKNDKLLEDGRKTTDKMERKKIYADFQKYLVDDAPAAFLYYPTVYTVKRE